MAGVAHRHNYFLILSYYIRITHHQIGIVKFRAIMFRPSENIILRFGNAARKFSL